MSEHIEPIWCVSLWQPWAHLMAIGAKQNETRSWPTKYRGWLAIHAAKKWDRTLLAMSQRPPFIHRLRRSDVCTADIKRFAFGSIVCVVRLHDCQLITADNKPGSDEEAFGDYAPGRFMLKTNDRRRMHTPIPYKGHQGLREIKDAAVLAEIRRQMA